MSYRTAIPTGTPPKQHEVIIVKIENLDQDGRGFNPPQIEYWVCSADGRRTVIEIFGSFAEAAEFIFQNNYRLVAAPAP